jgi:transcriptional regulator
MTKAAPKKARKTAQIDGQISISVSLNVKKGESADDLRVKVIEAMRQALYDLKDVDGEPYCDEYQSLIVEFE